MKLKLGGIKSTDLRVKHKIKIYFNKRIIKNTHPFKSITAFFNEYGIIGICFELYITQLYWGV